MSKEAVVIYHGPGCMDGFASAWAFTQGKSSDYSDVQYVPMNYGDSPFEISFSGKDVYILDFSFPRNDLTAISAIADNVLVLDHHKTAQEALTDWDEKPENCVIRFDMNKSGCLLTWMEFYLDNPPALIRYVNDRDLWLFKEPSSKEINAVIAITLMNFPAYNNLSRALNTKYDTCVQIGEHLAVQHQKICEEIILDARHTTIITEEGNYEGQSCNCTPQFSSEVGNLLSKKSGSFGATYYSDREGKVKWSLRSIGDYDVSKIAKCFNGGGHRNAAGFRIDLNLEEGVDPSRIVLSQVVKEKDSATKD